MSPKKELKTSPIKRSAMTDKDYKKFSAFIYDTVGIKLPMSKKCMIEARLQKRIRSTGKKDHKDYLEFLFSPHGLDSELISLIDVVTTNTTDFFREPKHFEYLSSILLPAWHNRPGIRKTLNIWSAGCSTGMEPYTLSIVLSEFKNKNHGFDFSILATDISTQALKTAVNAVYDLERIAPVPMEMKRKYFLKSKDQKKKLVRVAPELRKTIRFGRLNFMDEFKLPNLMDIIFCRNVVIYFDKPTQHRLFSKFCRNLEIGGHLFIGHSESLAGMELPLSQVAPTVYRRI